MDRIRERFFGRSTPDTTELTNQVGQMARPLEGPEDLDPLLERIGEARCVLLGEASHGTSEYYTWRARISERLIWEKGFSFIAVEGDWPDCYEVNRYVKGYPDSGMNAREVLEAFERWPTWMWANEEVVGLAEWLRHHNEGVPEGERVGFYGLDVYSLWESMESVIEYLERVDPVAVEAAHRAYSCFEPYGEDVREYARATAFVPTSCEGEVVGLLSELRGRIQEYRDDPESRPEGRGGGLGLKVAATADIHARVGDTEILRALASSAAQDADVLTLGGDLTDLGRLEEAEVLLQAFDDCPIPVIATLGNHDHESGNAQEISRLLAQSSIHLLDRSSVVMDGVGFSGVKGFCGGFDETIANSFGEDLFKAWVTEGILEAEALKNELRALQTERRVAVLHYAPIRATVEGEPPEIHAFLGTSRLGAALDDGGATIAFHGHAHNGPFRGKTPGGVPVFNVSLPVIAQEGLEQPYLVLDV